MSLLEQFFRGYNPERDGIASAPRKGGLQTSKRPSAILSGQKPDETQLTNFKAVRQTENGAEWERTKRNISPVLGRKHVLTDHDLLEMSASKHKLFEEKAERLKPYWAAGFSIEETASEIDAWGYGSSTIANYFACFSRAHERQPKSTQLGN